MSARIAGPPAGRGYALLLACAALASACRAAPAGLVDPDTGIRLIRIPAGRFFMGSPPAEAHRGEDETLHAVSLTHPFLMGQYEVTQAEWRRFVGTSPAHHAGCERCPVERINFYDAERFVTAVNAKSRRFRYRLPTEAEWEDACRAGTTTPFATGGRLSTDQANYNGTYPYDGPKGVNRGTTTPVGAFPPNAWGLYDLHGNVWEWTSDWYGPLPRRPR